MVELVDTLDLGSSAAMREGSSPFIRTIVNCPVRLSVRTTAFQAVKRSSILLRDTI